MPFTLRWRAGRRAEHMNRRDFDTLARAFRKVDLRGPLALRAVLETLANEIAHDNANFDRDKFLIRCGLSVKPKTVGMVEAMGFDA